MVRVDPNIIDTFRTRGVAVLRGVFTEWVETLQAGVAQNFRAPSASGHLYQGENGAGRFLSDYCNWQRIPQYRDFIFNSPAAAVGAQLMGSDVVRLFHEHVLVKEASTDVPTPWHQDMPYYCVSGPKTVSLWIPLDEVARENMVEFVAGSHLWGKYYRPQRFNGQALNEGDGLETIPDINGNRGDYDLVSWSVSPGDAVAFDYRTLHGAPANTSATTSRRAFSLRLVGDSTSFVRRAGIKTSPPFPEVTLENGAPLEGAQFPVLYPRA